MSFSYTNSASNTYSESRARYVIGKIFDDFHAIAFRGFDYFRRNPQTLEDWKEDLYFLMTNQVLEKFQIQFIGSYEHKWAVEYNIKSDGSIHLDHDSGGVNYWEIPANVSVGIVASWSRHKKHVEDHMLKRGWTGNGEYVQGDLIDDGAYSTNGFGANKGRRGAWKR